MENNRIRQLRRRIKTWHTAMWMSAILVLLSISLILLSQYIIIKETGNLSEGTKEAIQYIVMGFALALFPLMYTSFNHAIGQLQLIEDQIYELGNYLYLTDRLDEDNRVYFEKNILKSKGK